MNLITRMRALASDDAGQDLLEYALLAGLIAIVPLVAIVERWRGAGWAEVEEGRVRLTAEGWLLLDRLAVELEATAA